MTELPRTADLTSLADELQRSGKARKLRPLVRAVSKAQSCLADLRQSHDCFALIETVEDRDTELGTIIENALLNTAVGLYVRATHTYAQGQTERGPLSIARSFTDDGDREAHQRLVVTRNNALAHVNTGLAVADLVWHEQAVVAVETEAGMWRPASFSNHIAVSKQCIRDLARVLPLGLQELKSRLNGAMTKLMTELASTLPPAELQQSLRQHPFDLVKFLGSEEAAVKAIRRAGPGGEVRGVAKRLDCSG